MRTKFIFLMVILSLSLLPITPVTGQENSTPPAPIFDGIDPTGDPSGSFQYDINTTVTITYKADRFDVDGLLLLGSGSGLIEDYINNPSQARNFTKVSSFRDKSTYEIELNVTTYTYFYALAWSGSYSNATMEETEGLADQPEHQLWVNEGPLFPELDDTNATLRDTSYYANYNSDINLKYRFRDPENSTTQDITLVFSENSTGVYETDKQFLSVNMTKIDYQEVDNFNYSIYEYNFTMDRHIAYFTAFNDYGWEKEEFKPVVHKITTGFSFNETFSEPLDLYTTLDDIEFNITTYNESDDMSVGYQYRYFENNTVDDPIQDWEVVELPNNDTFAYVNTSIDGDVVINSTLKMEYFASLENTFEANNLIELQTFVEYGEGSNESSQVYRINILDPTPTLEVTSANNTITNKINATVIYDFDTPKGEINTATINQSLPNGVSRTYNIINSENTTIEFTPTVASTTIIEGTHEFFFNVTNSLNQSITKLITYRVDITAPTGNITILNLGDDLTTTDGNVSVAISFADALSTDTGVKFVSLDWGNNITIDVTNRKSATMQYRRSGDYTLTLTVVDKAGNIRNNITVTISVDLPSDGDSNDEETPIPTMYMILPLVGFAAIISYKRKKNLR